MANPDSRGIFVTVVIPIWSLLSLPFLSSCQGSAANDEQPNLTAKIFALQEEEIRFTSGQATLAGTLFRPSEKADCPAVVILAGSDRSRRGPLRIRLAEHFAAHNVAALVYDSPGSGNSTGNAMVQTRRDRANEAVAAVDYLRALPGVNSTSVGVFGGSEGADVALIAASNAPQIAFVIAVSGPMGVPVLEAMRYSAEMSGHEQGLTLDEISKSITFKEIAFVFFSGVEIVEWPLIEMRVKQWDDKTWATFINLAKQRKQELNRPQQQLWLDSFRQVIAHFKNQRWFAVADVGNGIQQAADLDVDQFFQLVQAPRYTQDWEGDLGDVSNVRCPVLAIWGQQDSFVPPNQASLRLKTALTESHHPDFRIEIFPDASHFLTESSPATEFVSGYLETMTDWLGERFSFDGAGGN